MAYHVLKHHECYEDLGHDYFDKRNKRHLEKHFVKRLEGLGYQVTLEPAVQAA